MAEEITIGWDDYQTLGVGLWLMGTVLRDRLGDAPVEQTHEGVKPALQIAEFLPEALKGVSGGLDAWLTGGAVESWATFRVEDRDGNEVKFPIRVVAEADIRPRT